MHAVHSAERTDDSTSTGRPAGHAFAHFAQSMQASASRTIRVGLASDTTPMSAPYGHKYRHQTFFTKSDATTRAASTIAVASPIWRKKFSIFTSATWPYGLPRNARISGTGIAITT